MTIHELIERSGFNRRTIYFYTQMELLPPPKGKGKTYEYSEEHLKRLEQIKKLQAMRYSLKEIRELLAQPDFTIEEQTTRYFFVSTPKMAKEQLEMSSGGSAESAALWRRFRLGPETELHIKWPPSQTALENLENQLKALIQNIKGELK